MGWRFEVLKLIWDYGGEDALEEAAKRWAKYEKKRQKKNGNYYKQKTQSSKSKQHNNSTVKKKSNNSYVKDDDIDDVVDDSYDVYQAYLDNYKNVDEETRIRSMLAQRIPQIPVYDFDVDLKCAKCGGRRYIDVYKGTVECTNCHIIKDLDILRYEDDKAALEQAYEEYKNDEEYERRRRQKLEEQQRLEQKKIADAERKPVLKYTVLLPYTILVWIFDRYLNMKYIGMAVGAIITLLFDGLIVLLLIEWIGGGI